MSHYVMSHCVGLIRHKLNVNHDCCGLYLGPIVSCYGKTGSDVLRVLTVPGGAPTSPGTITNFLQPLIYAQPVFFPIEDKDGYPRVAWTRTNLGKLWLTCLLHEPSYCSRAAGSSKPIDFATGTACAHQRCSSDFLQQELGRKVCGTQQLSEQNSLRCASKSSFHQQKTCTKTDGL